MEIITGLVILLNLLLIVYLVGPQGYDKIPEGYIGAIASPGGKIKQRKPGMFFILWGIEEVRAKIPTGVSIISSDSVDEHTNIKYELRTITIQDPTNNVVFEGTPEGLLEYRIYDIRKFLINVADKNPLAEMWEFIQAHVFEYLSSIPFSYFSGSGITDYTAINRELSHRIIRDQRISRLGVEIRSFRIKDIDWSPSTHSYWVIQSTAVATAAAIRLTAQAEAEAERIRTEAQQARVKALGDNYAVARIAEAIEEAKPNVVGGDVLHSLLPRRKGDNSE